MVGCPRFVASLNENPTGIQLEMCVSINLCKLTDRGLQTITGLQTLGLEKNNCNIHTCIRFFPQTTLLKPHTNLF